ncbi:MAG: HlyD family efflux transporter periplasmic adaptor subunit [Ignavibacteriae bacterium]|nr:HlyD family efflux transporter periplasmic adaptor subunit [Ignavibacteriota bacterium]NOG98089.1 HlyD family efflux transporter periplasmic adaptor subunit [Ignavibacteriota bacterium]
MKLSFSSALILSLIILSSCGGKGGSDVIEESGTIETTNSIVSSQAVGPVKNILVNEGSFVKSGDTVLIIDHEKYELQLDQALAAKSAAQAQLNLIRKGAREEDILLVKEKLKQAKSNFESAQKDKMRFEKLLESQAITQKQFDDAATRFDVASSQLASAKENLNKIKNIARPEEIKQAEANFKKAQASAALIQKSIRDCFVTSPFDGYIVNQFVEKGEMLSMMSSLFKVSDLSQVELVVYVSGEDLGKVKLGQTAEVSTDSYKDKIYEGKVFYISSEAEFTPKNIQTKDERTKLVYAVKIKIPNPDFELKAGMPGDAGILLRE